MKKSINEILEGNNVSNQEESMRNKEFIAKWYAENEHLLEPMVEESVDISTRDAVLIKQWFYNVEGTNTGRRISPKFNKYEESNHVSRVDVVEDEYLMESWTDERGREHKIYDRGGLFGSQYKRYQQSITSGDMSKMFRNSHFEDGLNPGESVVTDERGNFIGFMSTASKAAYERRVKAQLKADAEYLAVRYQDRRKEEVEMRDYARKVYAMIYRRITRLNHYGEMKDLIYRSQRLVVKALRKKYSEVVQDLIAEGGNHAKVRYYLSRMRGNAFYIYQPVKYSAEQGELVNMNILFHKVERQQLWKAVDESKWKADRLGKLETARAKYQKLMSAVSITINPYDQADLISNGKVALSKQDAEDILTHCFSKTNTDRLSRPVYYAVKGIAA